MLEDAQDPLVAHLSTITRMGSCPISAGVLSKIPWVDYGVANCQFAKTPQRMPQTGAALERNVEVITGRLACSSTVGWGLEMDNAGSIISVVIASLIVGFLGPDFLGAIGFGCRRY